MHLVDRFAAALVEELRAQPTPRAINEGDLERRFLLPLVRDVQSRFPGLHVYAHAWNQPETCEPDCARGTGLVEGVRLHGCPRCWAASRAWAATRLYGMHCSDLVVGEPGESLAVALKLLRLAVRSKRANDRLNILLGQCLLARLVHRRVIGCCFAEQGALDFDAAGYEDKLRKHGVTLVVKPVLPGIVMLPRIRAMSVETV